MTAVLDVKNLSVEFGNNAGRVVDDVSFSLAPGEILGIVGESGSGKSVTCRALMGLLPKHAERAGNVLFDGYQLSEMSDIELQIVRGRGISMIFQNPSSHLNPLMSIGHHVAEPLRRHFGMDARAARQAALKLLDEVSIRDAASRYDAYPHELSGGMKQRVLIASALACQPKVLLADEPTTALDVTVQSGILELLKGLNRERGLSMILVSHDLGVISEICHRVVVMRNGKVVEQGTLQDVITCPQHAFTRELIDAQPGRLPVLSDDRSQHNQVAIEVEHLNIHFSDSIGFASLVRRQPHAVRAVNDVTFNVHAGECFGIVGESGSGKSTIARAMVRLISSTAGEIRDHGRPIDQLSGRDLTDYRQQVQMVFQSPYDSLNPRMTVHDTIAEPIWRHGLADSSVALTLAQTLMDRVELPRALADRKPRQLSGGQCQRVAIARALALSPRVLIADEVTSALDVTIQAQILALLARLKSEQNLTIIFISHDLAIVRKFCDRVAVFRNGELIESGPTIEVFDNPRDSYTRALVAAAPDLDAALAKQLAS